MAIAFSRKSLRRTKELKQKGYPMIKKLVVLLALGLFPSISLSLDRAAVEESIEQIDQLRKSLVKGVTAHPTKETFKQVCSPVGLNIKQRAKEKNISIRQVSHKERNPKHGANKNEMLAIELFQKRSDIDSLWLNIKGKRHYFKKIIVQKDCLACHGEKSRRPDFVKSQYPGDKAFGFKVGDIRGVYHVKDK